MPLLIKDGKKAAAVLLLTTTVHKILGPGILMKPYRVLIFQNHNSVLSKRIQKNIPPNRVGMN